VTLLLFVRRLHLYLGLALLPWVVMFGLSSYPFNHPAQLQPKWTVQFDRPYRLDAATTGDLHATGARILRDAGFSGGFYVNQPTPQRINVTHTNFMHPTRITYFIDQQRLLAEEREFVWRQFLTSMHAHNGYALDGPLNKVWAVVIDLVCLALIVWIASGYVMWWLLPGSRSWGWIAIAAGVATFGYVVAVL